MDLTIKKIRLRDEKKHIFRKSLALLSLLALVVVPITASATSIIYGEPITINNPTPVVDDFFGVSVAIDGDKFIVGAPRDNTGYTDAGSAYLFDATTGVLLHTLNNPTPAGYEEFGRSVSISGDKILIGAPGDDTGAYNAGSAYLYDATTGALIQTFNNPTPAENDLFGWSVSISNDKVLIGASSQTVGYNISSAYLYDAVTGVLLHTFNGGYSVSLSGNKVLVASNPAFSYGHADLYDAITGTLLYGFNNPTPAIGDYFGNSVSISGDKVLISAPYDDTGATDAGSAYLYDAMTGALLQTFNNPAPATGDNFGQAVSISGDKMLISAHNNYIGVFRYGSVYIYDAITGSLLQTINNLTSEGGDFFGFSVSISGDTVLVGKPYNNTGANQAGSVYLYLPLPDTDGDGIEDGTDNCPADANVDQTDTDGDGQGDTCDFTPNGDTDGDGVDNLADNCPGVFNPGQEDNDGDGLGNVCDPTPNGDLNPNPTSIDQCKQLGWIDFSFRNQGQCVAFVNTGHDSR